MLTLTIAVAVVAAPAGQASEAIRLDAKGRPTIAVAVDGRGPFDMLVDTAAQASVMTTALVEELGLKPLDERILVRGSTGNSVARPYAVARIRAAVFDRRDVGLLALPHITVTNARGIVGMDLFAGRKLVFDLAARRLSVEASGPPGARTVAVAGRNTDNRITIPIVVDGVTVQATVDTGAEGSVGNAAMLRALGWRDDDPRLKAAGTAGGVGTAIATVREGRVATVAIGPVKFGNVPITFLSGNLPGDSDDAPAMVLGMDMLGLLQRFAVDLPRAELQIYVPPPPAPTAPPARG